MIILSLGLCRQMVQYILLLGVLATYFSSPSQAVENLFQEHSVRTGVYLKSFPDISRYDMETVMQYWGKEIAQYIGIPIHTHVYTSIALMRNDFDRGKINVILASPLNIINEFDLNQLADGYMAVKQDKVADKLLLVTQKQSGINSIQDCKNKQLMLVENDAIGTMYIDVLMLQAFDKPAKSIFKSIQYAQKSNQLVLNLFFDRTEVIIVYKHFYELANELNPQIKNQTQVIATLDKVPHGLGFFHKKVPSAFREKVLAEFFKLEQTPRGEQLLTVFHAEKLVPASIDNLIAIKQLKQQYKSLASKNSTH
ncbi:MAG: hypothetical protein methR_P3818 [Methyloprofundus sp.]|nr:MAG: hypothetical protein methR_P3818 [Methyloprofundus sp.]